MAIDTCCHNCKIVASRGNKQRGNRLLQRFLFCGNKFRCCHGMDVAKSHIATLHIVVIKIIATTPYVALVLRTKLKV